LPIGHYTRISAAAKRGGPKKPYLYKNYTQIIHPAYGERLIAGGVLLRCKNMSATISSQWTIFDAAPSPELAVALLAAVPLGVYVRQVYCGETTFLSPLIEPIERALYRLAGIDPAAPMSGPAYTGLAAMFAAMAGLLSLLCPGSIGIVVRNVLGSGVTMALVAAGLRRAAGRPGVGNVWADLVRGHLYVLLPLSCLALLLLATAGAADVLDAYARLHRQDIAPTLPVARLEAAHLVAALETGRATSLPTLHWLTFLSHALLPFAFGISLVVSFAGSRPLQAAQT